MLWRQWYEISVAEKRQERPLHFKGLHGRLFGGYGVGKHFSGDSFVIRADRFLK